MRKFAGETGKPGGVYITSSVEPGLPAEKAGLKAGDIITAIGDHEIDENGNYVDPLYGKIEFGNLLDRESLCRRYRSRSTSSAKANRSP